MNNPTCPGSIARSPQSIPRRRMLRGVSVALALPMLDAMRPLAKRAAAAELSGPAPMRSLAICNNLGLLPDRFFPQQAGRGYRTRVALIVEHADAARCGTLARLLRLAGWRTAVAPQGTPLADVWHHAMVGADIGRLVRARR